MKILCWGENVRLRRKFWVQAKILGLDENFRFGEKILGLGENFKARAKILGSGENFGFGRKF